jgi:hypothetical protein
MAEGQRTPHDLVVGECPPIAVDKRRRPAAKARARIEQRLEHGFLRPRQIEGHDLLPRSRGNGGKSHGGAFILAAYRK